MALSADDVSVMFGDPPFSSAFQSTAETPASGMAAQAVSGDIRVIAYQPEHVGAGDLLQAYLQARRASEPELVESEIPIEGLATFADEAALHAKP